MAIVDTSLSHELILCFPKPASACWLHLPFPKHQLEFLIASAMLSSSLPRTIAEDRLGSLIAEDLICPTTTTKSFLRSRLLLVQCSALKAFWLYVSNPEDLRCYCMMGLFSNPHMQVSYLSMLQGLIL